MPPKRWLPTDLQGSSADSWRQATSAQLEGLLSQLQSGKPNKNNGNKVTFRSCKMMVSLIHLKLCGVKGGLYLGKGFHMIS